MEWLYECNILLVWRLLFLLYDSQSSNKLCRILHAVRIYLYRECCCHRTTSTSHPFIHPPHPHPHHLLLRIPFATVLVSNLINIWCWRYATDNANQTLFCSIEYTQTHPHISQVVGCMCIQRAKEERDRLQSTLFPKLPPGAWMWTPSYCHLKHSIRILDIQVLMKCIV